MLHQKSTLLEPILSMRASDVRSMPKGRFAEIVIPLYYEGYVYRAGSRIRVTVSAPNGTQLTPAADVPVGTVALAQRTV